MESRSRSPSPSPTPSFDDDGNVFVPPSPLYMDGPPSPFDDHAAAARPPSPVYIPQIIPAPPIFVYEPPRGRSRSRSRSRSYDHSRRRSYSPGGYDPVYSRPRYPRPHRSPPRSLNSSLRSPSPPRAAPARRRYHYRNSRSRSLSESPVRRYSCAGQPTVIVTQPPPPPPTITPMLPPSCIQPAPITIVGPPMNEPVDILTFQYNDNKAYAPAAKTYDEAIDIVRDVWPELHSFDRDRIHLYVGSADSRVRVPKVAWEFVLCDLSRYEVVHIQVDEPPPPPQYQGDVKGKWSDDGNGKGRRSRGIFSSIKRLFRRG